MATKLSLLLLASASLSLMTATPRPASACTGDIGYDGEYGGARVSVKDVNTNDVCPTLTGGTLVLDDPDGETEKDFLVKRENW